MFGSVSVDKLIMKSIRFFSTVLRAKVQNACIQSEYQSHLSTESSTAQYEPNTWMKKLSLTIRLPNLFLFACRRLVLEKTRHLGGVDMASQVVTHRHQSPHSQLPCQSSLSRHPHTQIWPNSKVYSLILSSLVSSLFIAEK